ncbi:hypothetical protein [Ruania halotolerans]|uniref:hypothetical protein n=1 Tax=Ruania halotolerans TaxID=2897773 RepID=UPI001E39E88C|nr:hypothetical protein [Ruania halotolerans]UFU04979.1 hypothetical protein LQF10_10855 [Ruania halotolerans]
MSDDAPKTKPSSSAPPPWIRTVTTVLGALILAIVLFVLGSALLPGWWASIVTGWVDGVSSAGVLTGLLCGVIFTLVPLAVGYLAIRLRKPWRTRLIIGAVAVLLTLPVVLTIAIDASTTLAATEARTDMVIGAPSFTGAVYGGALGAVAVAAVAIALTWRMLTSRRKVRALSGDLAKGKAREKDRAARDAAAEEARTAAARDAAAREREAGGPPAPRPDSAESAGEPPAER